MRACLRYIGTHPTMSAQSEVVNPRVSGHRPGGRQDRFFGVMSVLAALTVFAGFSRTYSLPPSPGYP